MRISVVASIHKKGFIQYVDYLGMGLGFLWHLRCVALFRVLNAVGQPQPYKKKY